jgi:hypothetical protein
MVEWPEEFKKQIKEKYNHEFLGWARANPLGDAEIQECKELIYEHAKESLQEKGVDISSLQTEWIVKVSPYNLVDPLDQSLMICLNHKAEVHG